MTNPAAIVPVKLAGLKDWISRVLVKQGMFAVDADIAALRLIESELLGRPAGGLRWLPRLRDAMDLGDIDPRAQFITLTDLPALLEIDGSTGVGQVALTKALELAARKAVAVGSAVLVVRNSRPVGDPTACLSVATSAGCFAGIMTSCKPQQEPWPIGPCTVWGWAGDDSPLITSATPPAMTADLAALVLSTAVAGTKLATIKKRLFADDAEHLAFVVDAARCNGDGTFLQTSAQVDPQLVSKAPDWLCTEQVWPETAPIPAATAAELKELAAAVHIPAEW